MIKDYIKNWIIGCYLIILFFCLYNVWLIHSTISRTSSPSDQGIVRILDLHASSIGRRRLSLVKEYLANLPSYFQLHDLRSKVNDAGFNCTVSKTAPRFPVCVYEPEADQYISGALLSGGVWEPYLTKVFQIALTKHPNAVVIDIGANIGYFSLLAAKMGHNVIAVEPVAENVRRFHKGVQLNNFQDSVNLLKNAMSNRHQNVSLSVNKSNQGGIKVIENVQEGETIPTITLDDLLFVMTPNEAIIKIDIEGYECKALSVSKQFFNTIHVPYIFMEWQQMFKNRHQASPCPISSIHHLTDMLARRGFVPHEVHTGIELNVERSTTIWRVGDIYWRHKSHPLLIPSL
ncbi:uncharacterized protein LOC126812128 isoform X2 [Patella vulgata]|uniref:uncharacterized protein LOC126812128 isoform X2 n=1 Tax=Patella vulgata TaxID=6465 RepID=UPI00217F4620|nr:uncharacterized protein LOC126812128 isoform X2 [Patella vulgata]